MLIDVSTMTFMPYDRTSMGLLVPRVPKFREMINGRMLLRVHKSHF